MNDELEQFLNHKYINLETYRKSGKVIQTPVWFVIKNDTIFVMTTKDTGKVKRLRNNQNVRIAPCGFRGELKGDWVNGKVRFAEREETKLAIDLRKKKYGFQARIIGALVARKGEPIVIAIQI